MPKFLITDDDPAGRRLLCHYLAPYGQCDLAFNGEEAIDFFRLALDEGQPYDLVCLDLMMPGTSGHEVLQTLRQIESARGVYGSDGAKVLVITAMSDPKHCIRAFGEGCESYITKPIYQQRLLMEVQSLLGKLPAPSRPKAEHPRSSRSAPGESGLPRYLIVDDDRLCRELLKDLLSPYGHCDFAYNGAEAIDAVRLALEDARPYTLICLDIMMPGTSGHQVLEQVRKLEHRHGIDGLDGVKIIMTTALRASKHVVQAFHEGCEAYLVKPIKADALLARMRELGVMPAAAATS